MVDMMAGIALITVYCFCVVYDIPLINFVFGALVGWCSMETVLSGYKKTKKKES